MIRYLLRRLGFLFITLLLTSLIILLITQVIPGDVAQVVLGREAGEAALEVFRAQYGLTDPVWVQYVRWVSNFLTGDWGDSLSLRTEILPLILLRAKNSAILAATTLIIAVPISITLGTLAAIYENRLPDIITNVLSLSFVGLPEFVTGLLLIQIFSTWLNILPASSSFPTGAAWFEIIPYTMLPAITATLVLIAYLARLTRAGVIEEMRQPYVRTATLLGLPPRTIFIKYILRNALLPTITVIAISIGWLMSGLIVIENVFNYPGLGRLLLFAIDRRDLPLIQAIAMLTVFAYASANLGADLLYAHLNPRIRLG